MKGPLSSSGSNQANGKNLLNEQSSSSCKQVSRGRGSSQPCLRRIPIPPKEFVLYRFVLGIENGQQEEKQRQLFLRIWGRDAELKALKYTKHLEETVKWNREHAEAALAGGMPTMEGEGLTPLALREGTWMLLTGFSVELDPLEKKLKVQEVYEALSRSFWPNVSGPEPDAKNIEEVQR